MLLTTLPAITVNIVTSEENARLVAVGNLGVPANWLTGGRVTKVFCVDLRLVAPAKDMVAGMTGKYNCLVKTLLEHRALSSIARCMDGEAIDGAGVPCGRTHSDLRAFAGGDGEGVAWSDRSSHDGGGSKEHKGSSAGKHGKDDLRVLNESYLLG